MNIVILDLDNCISDDGWRIPMIDFSATGDARYEAYHRSHVGDMPGNRDLYCDKSNHYVVITGRPGNYLMSTLKWLSAEGIVPIEVYMRPVGVHMPAIELKRTAVQNLLAKTHIINRLNKIKAYDDRQDIIDMYTSIGIPAERRFIHNLVAERPSGAA